MDLLGKFINFFIALVLIVGGYQFYFWPQDRSIVKVPKSLLIRLDNSIPFKPSWVWIYSFLYYPIILFLAFSVDSFKEFNYIVFNFLILLFFQLLFFIFFPVSTPERWRNFDREKNLSTRFLGLVHSYDSTSTSTSFPSMHVSVATLVALHLFNLYAPQFGGWALCVYIFPILISISTLYTKQHYIVDVPAGVILGWLVYKFHEMIFTIF